MHSFDFLDELVLLCVAATIIIVLFRRLRMPPIIGLIVTGLILGPSGVGIVQESAVMSSIAELGVVMLLFTIGLEFSITDLA
ncbi:MAG: cation:proton antiporter [Bacteroidetes bacterium]|nr:cation:proton antiporter [Bacteroidota bacterium]